MNKDEAVSECNILINLLKEDVSNLSKGLGGEILQEYKTIVDEEIHFAEELLEEINITVV